MTTKVIKNVCDRCGESTEIEVGGIDDPLSSRGNYPNDWQHIQLGQTGAQLDLCVSCNLDLLGFLEEKEATGMENAVINKRELL